MLSELNMKKNIGAWSAWVGNLSAFDKVPKEFWRYDRCSKESTTLMTSIITLWLGAQCFTTTISSYKPKQINGFNALFLRI